MSNCNLELKQLNDTKNNIKITDEEKNIIKNREIEIYETRFLKIPYFYFGNTLNFYFPFKKILPEEFKYPIFSLGNNKIILPLVIIVVTIVYSLFYILINKITDSYIYKKIMPFIIITLFILAWILYILNPGIQFNPSESPNLENTIYCKNCRMNFNKTLKIKHCSYCNVCVYGYDHHCIAIGKCIGRRNNILFYFIVVMLCLMQSLDMYQVIKFIYKYITGRNNK